MIGRAWLNGVMEVDVDMKSRDQGGGQYGFGRGGGFQGSRK